LQAFQNLLNLHILFCPPPDSEAEDSLGNLLSLTLDEEVQIRCAAFVQSEIERFAEEVAAHSDGSGDEGTSSDDDAAPRKGARRKGKKTVNGTKEAAAAALAGASIANIYSYIWTWVMLLCR
jgi:cohesin complex subunit SA-1/2